MHLAASSIFYIWLMISFADVTVVDERGQAELNSLYVVNDL